MDKQFWEVVERLVSDSEIVIDRPKNSAHPRFPDMIYPLDYGYLANTASPDGDGIDVWLGSLPEKRTQAVICIVDLIKRDSEIKLLIGCTEAEQEIILKFHNNSEFMKGLLIKRGS